LLLAPGQLDAALQLVLRDRPLLLHRDRTARVGGPVGILLHRLAGGRLQRALQVGLRPDRDHPRRDDGDAGLGQARVAGERGRDGLAHRRDAGGERLGELQPGEQVERRLLGQFGEQRGNLVQRLGPPVAALRVDREVEPFGGERRVGEPVRDGGLHGDVCEVGGAGVEEQGKFPIVDRYLGEHRRQRPVPERLPDTLVPHLAPDGVPDEAGRRAAQVAQEEPPRDVSHVPASCYRHSDDNPARHLSSRW
jgi:hypothetical protein